MKYSSKLLAAVTLLLFVLAYYNWPKIEQRLKNSDPSLYSVETFIDGDTFSVLIDNKEEKVRMLGIDTPEKNHPDLPVQCFAKAASKHLEELIGNSKVRLEADPSSDTRDIYNRLLRFVYLPDGTFVNGRMIADGYAFAYTSFANSKTPQLIKLEKQARDKKLGLWGTCQTEIKNGKPQTNNASTNN